MGGDCAKERRRLKRVQAQAVTANPVTSTPARINPSTEQKWEPKAIMKDNNTPFSGQSNSSSALLRLKRKSERKDAGKFKTGNTSQKLPLESKQENGKLAERVHSLPSKRPKTTAPKQDNSNNRKSLPANPKTNLLPSKKKTKKDTSEANKKPKHLKRKVEQLSKSLHNGSATGSSGTDITQLEAQMKELAAQIEHFKRIKSSTETDYVADKIIPQSQPENQSKRNVKDALSVKSSRSSDSPDVRSSAPDANVLTDPAKENKALLTTPSSSSSENDSASSDEEDVKDSSARSRGKRRRGRRNECSSKEKANLDEELPLETNTEESEGKQAQRSTDEAKTASKKKTPKKEDSRRCIGRKPVTDYVVGQKYSGRVKYIKSAMGAFIDIGSHSDAFCHISCISDEYAKSVDDVLKLNDAVEVRVVEIDREKKRITVSLRSEEMAQKEQDALKAKQSVQTSKKKSGKKTQHTHFETNNPEKEDNEEKENIVQTKTKTELRTSERGTQSKESSAEQKSGADLKRERKLARRAERRAQKSTE